MATTVTAPKKTAELSFAEKVAKATKIKDSEARFDALLELWEEAKDRESTGKIDRQDSQAMIIDQIADLYEKEQGEAPAEKRGLVAIGSYKKITVSAKTLGKDWKHDKLKKLLKKAYDRCFTHKLNLTFATQADLEAALATLKEAGLTSESGRIVSATAEYDVFDEKVVDNLVSEGTVKKSAVEDCYETRYGSEYISVSKADKKKVAKTVIL